jgi:hypothetical protein
MAAAVNTAVRIRTHLRRREFTLGLTPNFTWHTESMVQRQPRSPADTWAGTDGRNGREAQADRKTNVDLGVT